MVKTACGFVIFRIMSDKIEYLLLQTSYGIHHWTPPKGHVDPGESEMQTAIRETQEEAGLSAKHLKIYECCKETISYLVNNKPKNVIYWLAQLKNPNQRVILSHEHQDLKWLEVDEACKFAEFKEMQSIIRSFHEYILKNVHQ